MNEKTKEQVASIYDSSKMMLTLEVGVLEVVEVGGKEVVINLSIEITQLPVTPPLTAKGEGEVIC